MAEHTDHETRKQHKTAFAFMLPIAIALSASFMFSANSITGNVVAGTATNTAPGAVIGMLTLVAFAVVTHLAFQLNKH